jgi:hypothetical protein
LDTARRDRLLSLTAPAILLAIAGLQLYQVRVNELAPWKGGGFGMFSTVDGPRRRIVRAYLVDDEGDEMPLRVPKRLERLSWEVRSIPTPDRVSNLAQEIAAEFNQSAAKAGAMVRGRHVRVEVWRVSFDPKASRLAAEKVEEETVER